MAARPFTLERLVSFSQNLKFKGEIPLYLLTNQIEFKGKLGCPEFFNNLFQTLPPTWEPEFLGFSFDYTKKILYMEASILDAGKVKYPLPVNLTKEASKIIFELQ